MSLEWPEQLDKISQGFQWSQVLFSALRAGVFKHLSTVQSSKELAAAVGWHPDAARRLLNALVSIGLVRRERGGYVNAPIAAACLVPGAAQDQSSILLHKGNSWESWSRLEESLVSGQALNEGRRERGPDELRAFILGMADIGRESAKRLLEVVDLRDRRSFLDIGAGPGTYAFAFLNATPGARATLFDLPEVLPITEEQAQIAGLEKRVTFQAGDLTRDHFGEGFDCILLSNIIHSYSAEMNESVVRRCHEALVPGGLLLIKDFLVAPEPEGPAFSMLFALHMLLHCTGGDVYSTDDVRAWTDAAGFQPGECRSLTEQSLVWIVKK